MPVATRRTTAPGALRGPLGADPTHLRAQRRKKRAASSRKRKRVGSCCDVSFGANAPCSKRKCKSSSKGGGVDGVEPEVDPIMLLPLPKDPRRVFEFTRPNGKVVRFAVDTLVDYLLSSGRFEDPESRLPFSDQDLARLDSQAKAVELNRPSVLAAKSNSMDWERKRFIEAAVSALDRCVGQVLARMMYLIETPTLSPMEARMEMVYRCLPEIFDYYAQMREFDADSADACLSLGLAFLRGPRNRPTEDPHNLLDFATSTINKIRQHASTLLGNAETLSFNIVIVSNMMLH